MTFAEIQQRALSAQKEIEKSTRIFVGAATCGQKAGAPSILEAVKAELAQYQIKANITEVGCNGLCYAEPLLDIAKSGQPRISYGKVTPDIARQLVKDYLVGNNPRPDLALGTTGEGTVAGIPRLAELPMLKPQMRLLMGNCGIIDPGSIDEYTARGGYRALAKALTMNPADVIAEVKKSNVRGRGGAGYPAGLKWESTARAHEKVRYFICNADEGDPGSFVDRTLMEGDPHLVIEGTLIGAYAIGAADAYIYVRSEYAHAYRLLENAVKQAEEKGLAGNNILGSGYSCKIILQRGAGAFICGEATALINSLEGRQGLPRIRPPYMAEEGLWNKPTCVNNVETLANVPLVINHGGESYARVGVGKSRGTKLFSLSGNIARTGVVEVPLGMTLRQLIEELGGGVPDGRNLKLVQPAGGMLGFIPGNMVDRPLDFESLAEIGSGLGSGGLVVFDDRACAIDLAHALIDFTYDEMCGKCAVGRLGTAQTRVILQHITGGKGVPEDIELLTDLVEVVSRTSLCPLCGGATGPMRSVLRYYRDELEAHIKEKRCPAHACAMT